MARRIIFLCLLLVNFYALPGQHYTYATISNYNTDNVISPATLSDMITASYRTDKQKVYAIFRWITDNIDYKVKPAILTRRQVISSLTTEQEDTGALKSLNERVAEKVLIEREAFCEGYARLFATLCAYANIRSEVVSGYVRGNNNRIGKAFRSNHSWNAVYFDSSWHLLDATWASGYVAYYSDQFIKRFDDYFFLTPPAQFIRSHYPEDIRWTLMNEPPTLKEFENSPFKHLGFFTRNIKGITPASGIIEASPGDTLYFEIEADDISDDMRVVDVNEINAVPLQDVTWWEYPKPNIIKTGNRVKCHYIVNDSSVQWLHVLYKYAVVLRYRLNVKI